MDAKKGVPKFLALLIILLVVVIIVTIIFEANKETQNIALMLGNNSGKRKEIVYSKTT